MFLAYKQRVDSVGDTGSHSAMKACSWPTLTVLVLGNSVWTPKLRIHRLTEKC